MHQTRFDRISKLFAERKLSRRKALATGATALVSTGASQVAAQDATPMAMPETEAAEKVMYLFVQSFQSGSIVPTEGTDGRYTVTLEQGLGQTIYFADRPSRDVGVTPTPQFLEGLGFSEENPPNAALIVETGVGETDIAVVELFNPIYDEATHTASYDVTVLESWEDDLELGLTDAPADLATFAPQFGAAHLFIDDCSGITVQCIDHAANDGIAGVYDGVGACWNYSVCMPCEPYGHTQPDRCSTQNYWTDKCNADHPVCDGNCGASFSYPFANC
jgi:hypothetical protein